MSTGSDKLGEAARGSFDFAIGDELRGERATLGRTLLDAQRDLRIKAAYIAAIEDADPSVFPNPSFIPGYVRSYARYLGRDPDEVYARFCAESGFAGPSAAGPKRGRAAAAATGASGPARSAGGSKGGKGAFPTFPMAEKRGGGLPLAALAALPVSAIGSVLVMLGLVAGLGYGGWTVLQNIQRVQFAPVEDLPVAVAAVEQPPAPEAPDLAETAFAELARPVTATALTDLYRQQELEVPILVPRDGPIAGIDPDRVGLVAAPVAPAADAAPPQPGAAPVGPEELAAVVAGPVDPLTAPVETPGLTVVAERAAWIRVYLADKTVVFEQILETGETYSPPPDLVAPLIWAGNSGSVYVRVGDTLRGPLGSGTRSVRDVALEPKAIVERYAEVEVVPEVISRAFDPGQPQADVALQ